MPTQLYEVRYPSVERIDPILVPRTSLVDYVIVADRYFSARQQAGVRREVEAVLAARGARVQKCMLKAGGSRLAITVRPADSLGGLGSFVVLDTLRELLRPRQPYVAVGFISRHASEWPGVYNMGLRLLGQLADDERAEVLGRIQRLPSVCGYRDDRPDGAAFDCLLSLRGKWTDDVYDFLLELRQIKVAFCATFNRAG